MPHRGASHLAQLLDKGGRSHDPRLEEVQVSSQRRRSLSLGYIVFVLLPSSRSESIVGHPTYKTTMRLTITNVDAEDENSYKCVAKNPRGESEGTIRLYSKYLSSVSSPCWTVFGDTRRRRLFFSLFKRHSSLRCLLFRCHKNGGGTS